MNPTLLVGGALGLLLLMSAAGNAWLFHERDKFLEAKSTAEQLNRDTAAAAGACTASVDELAKKGVEREKRLQRAMNLIAPQVERNQRASIAALSATARDAADLCGSLNAYLSEEIRKQNAERGSPAAGGSGDQ